MIAPYMFCQNIPGITLPLHPILERLDLDEQIEQYEDTQFLRDTPIRHIVVDSMKFGALAGARGAVGFATGYSSVAWFLPAPLTHVIGAITGFVFSTGFFMSNSCKYDLLTQRRVERIEGKISEIGKNLPSILSIVVTSVLNVHNPSQNQLRIAYSYFKNQHKQLT